MDFWKKIGTTAQKTYQYTTQKTTQLAKEMRLKSALQQDKNQIREEYAAIGRKVYGMYHTWALQQGEDMAEKLHEQSAEEIPELQQKTCTIDVLQHLKEECNKIDALSTDYTQVEQELLALKDLKQCTHCHAYIETDNHYCPHCGQEQD